MTGRQLLKRSLWALLSIALLFLAADYLYLGRAEPEAYLIPNGFRGPVILVFGWEGGEPMKHVDGKRIYRIPPSGIFVTSDRGNPGHVLSGDRRFFYVGQNGETSEIDEASDWQSDLRSRRGSKTALETTVFAFRRGTGALTFKGATNWCFFVAFVVGSPNDWEVLLSKRDELLHSLLAR